MLIELQGVRSINSNPRLAVSDRLAEKCDGLPAEGEDRRHDVPKGLVEC
jgi:hypothetical protein